MRTAFIQVAYISASILFILGLRSLTRPDRARRGMQQAAVGMLLAIAGTLVNHQILDYKWIALGMVIGVLLGYPLGMWVPMTAMPQRIALALSFSALAATLVGIAEYYTGVQSVEGISHAKAAALGFEVLLGSLTVAGTLVAAGKLQELITSRPLTFRGQNLINGACSRSSWDVRVPGHAARVVPRFYGMIGLAFVFGILFVLPSAAPTCPSWSRCSIRIRAGGVRDGVRDQQRGALIAGALDGASGFILSILMSKAIIGRSRTAVRRVRVQNAQYRDPQRGRAAGAIDQRGGRGDSAGVRAARHHHPGYGMAVAQSSIRCASSPKSSRSAAARSNTPFIRSPAACRGT